MGHYPMKPGSIVVLDQESYPQYKGKTGVLINMQWDVYKGEVWEVLIDGKLHPYVIAQTDMAYI